MPQIYWRNKMVLQNYILDQDKSYWKLVTLRTWFYLPCPLHLNMVCFACDIYFAYFTKTVKKLKFLCFCSLFINISQFTPTVSPWVVVYLVVQFRNGLNGFLFLILVGSLLNVVKGSIILLSLFLGIFLLQIYCLCIMSLWYMI